MDTGDIPAPVVGIV